MCDGDKNYGNVYEVGLKEAYGKTISWRNKVICMRVAKFVIT